jgi:uncharacterized protein (TIGR02996 family)
LPEVLKLVSIMTPHEAFLQTIAADPDDDAPRLVYADWLEEHAESAFAGLIRVQCELAQLRDENDYWLELKVREEALWRELQPHWAKAFADLRLFKMKPEDFQRGLIGLRSLGIETGRFVTGCQHWVFLLHIGHLTTGDAMVDEFFTCPQLWRVRSIDCQRSSVGDAAFAGFAEARYFHNLERLDCWRNQIGPAGIAALARCPSLTNLTELWLEENILGDEGVKLLVSSPVVEKLHTLRLCDNQIGDQGARALAASPYLTNLRRLRLSKNIITRWGAQALRDSPHLANVEEMLLPDELEEGPAGG